MSRQPQRAPNRLQRRACSGPDAEGTLPVTAARQAADQAQARYHELQRRNDAMIERRRDAIDRGDLMQSRRLAPEHRQVTQELRNAAHEWSLAVARLLDAELNERGY
jgi:hypothetical protein